MIYQNNVYTIPFIEVVKNNVCYIIRQHAHPDPMTPKDMEKNLAR